MDVEAQAPGAVEVPNIDADDEYFGMVDAHDTFKLVKRRPILPPLVHRAQGVVAFKRRCLRCQDERWRDEHRRSRLSRSSFFRSPRFDFLRAHLFANLLAHLLAPHSRLPSPPPAPAPMPAPSRTDAPQTATADSKPAARLSPEQKLQQLSPTTPTRAREEYAAQQEPVPRRVECDEEHEGTDGRLVGEHDEQKEEPGSTDPAHRFVLNKVDHRALRVWDIEPDLPDHTLSHAALDTIIILAIQPSAHRGGVCGVVVCLPDD
ncbi:hypothetical protein Rhopal_004939-T1 [Rhodotorula paludigena]|uniref:Uncharacterized protein n=1 Tax=Rhodotorula paludigena TaxID=86838 RepID=A0AAV5GN55_9BASI|nr:hypothetical protein Rhopal_004939-T1 [Rhodotorula paludigena]